MKTSPATIRRVLATFALLFVAAPQLAGAADVVGEVRVEPMRAVLVHPHRPQSLVVTTTTADGLTADLSRKAAYATEDAKVATVDAEGWIKPMADGKTRVTVSVDGKSI